MAEILKRRFVVLDATNIINFVTEQKKVRGFGTLHSRDIAHICNCPDANTAEFLVEAFNDALKKKGMYV